MKKLLKVTLILLAFQLMTGCTAAIRGFPEPPSTSTAAYPDPNYLLGDASMKKYTEETDPAKKKELRNEIIDARMEDIKAVSDLGVQSDQNKQEVRNDDSASTHSNRCS